MPTARLVQLGLETFLEKQESFLFVLVEKDSR